MGNKAHTVQLSSGRSSRALADYWQSLGGHAFQLDRDMTRHGATASKKKKRIPSHPRMLERRVEVWLSKVPPKYYPLIVEFLNGETKKR